MGSKQCPICGSSNVLSITGMTMHGYYEYNQCQSCLADWCTGSEELAIQ